jgi:hypothetical protein
MADTIFEDDYTRQQMGGGAKEGTATNEAWGMAYCQAWGF